MYAFLTVQETLLMATHFCMGFSLTQKEKEDYVTSIISVLGLKKATNTIIGDAKVGTGTEGGRALQLVVGSSYWYMRIEAHHHHHHHLGAEAVISFAHCFSFLFVH